MTTEKDLYNAYLDFSVAYLNACTDSNKEDRPEMNEKIFDSISKVVLKIEKPETFVPEPGSAAEKNLEELKKELKYDG